MKSSGVKGVSNMYIMKHSGWVELICGSMFSGKSEELIRRVRRDTYGNLKVKVYKPKIDNRYQNSSVASHSGTTTHAKAVDRAIEILEDVTDDIDVIGIDEVQFFDHDIVDIVSTLADRGFRVILAGLDTNFRGEPFEPMPGLLSISEFVTKLHAICPICSSPASRTQRLINGKPAAYDDPIILVGAKEAYEPRCRHHHEVPNHPRENKY